MQGRCARQMGWRRVSSMILLRYLFYIQQLLPHPDCFFLPSQTQTANRFLSKDTWWKWRVLECVMKFRNFLFLENSRWVAWLNIVRIRTQPCSETSTWPATVVSDHPKPHLICYGDHWSYPGTSTLPCIYHWQPMLFRPSCKRSQRFSRYRQHCFGIKNIQVNSFAFWRKCL